MLGKIDIEEYQSLAQKFKIRNRPTMVLLKKAFYLGYMLGFCYILR